MTVPLDLSAYRRYFPALQQEMNGQPVIYWDNPGGTQVAQQVIEAMTRYLREANANAHGAFLTSRHTDETIAAARQAMADFLNAASPAEIVFGPNMTTLTFAFSRAIGKTLQPGDEIIVTVLDHDANVAPWLALQERGVVVRTVDIHPEHVTLNLEDLQAKLNERTRLVAVGYASNAVGTINDVRRITELAHAVGALVWIDAVQYAPHGPIDVQALDADFLVCSAYKFFGPHLGILYGKREQLERFPAYKVRPASNAVPDRWETGTQNHEGLAGLLGAIDYLTLLGEEQAAHYGNDPALQSYAGRRHTLKVAMRAISDYEHQLSAQLLRGLREIQGLRIYGISGTTPEELAQRVPTVACTIDGRHPRELAVALGERGIFAWDGNYYALGLMERLGLEGRGGALRLGLCHYNTSAEIERVLGVLEELA
ncbi:cysteine desulfurase-like protein [Thermogemmatispora tikiterensis]|uniref:Cysteine desulfurase-like protein n=1 Tax=Thermogemmatispora tikiterensis TaxID=1825093 RepID=A0A328VB68_9CHLR|nr:cysteine desulfurase-like protein [Thermogemmatispora tikiterensis]RAQ94888.1 cysteine desulfurase-like protein [Thermogemmatispora tikiterensis]